MNKFEAVLLFSPNLSSPLITKEEKSFTKNIENSKGKVTVSYTHLRAHET